MEMEDQKAQLREIRELLLFNPSPYVAITYYLPRLISGEPLPPLADPLIHRADVYACEPEVLAARFDHVPQRRETGDRYFFTPCKRLKGRGKRSQRTVGNDGGSWVLQHTFDVDDAAGVKVGEHKTLVFKKNKVMTEWLMDEYRFFPCPQEALVDGGEMVICKIHINVSKSEAKKRPPPVAADRPCLKKMRAAPSSTPPVVHPARSPPFVPPPLAYAPPPAALPVAPVPVPAPAAAEGDDGDEERFFCTMDELLAVYAGEDLPAPDGINGSAVDQQAAVFASHEYGAIPTSGEFGDNLDMPPAEPEQQMPVLANDDDIDMDQFAASLEDDLCGAQDEEAPPADDKQPEQQLPVLASDASLEQLTRESADSLEDEFGFIQDQLPENSFPLIDDLQELNDFSNFVMPSGNIFGGDEQQLPILVSDEDGGIPAYDEAEKMDIDQFAASLEENLCRGQDEEALPADEQPPLPDPFTNAEFNEMLMDDENVVFSQDNLAFIQDELSKNSFPMMDDFSNFGEQQTVSMFTLDQLEGHTEFISYS